MPDHPATPHPSDPHGSATPPAPAPPDQPITAKTILAAAIAGTDLPPVGDGTSTDWAAQFKDDTTKARAGELLHACAIADLPNARNLARQVEDSYLRQQVGGKPAGHV